LLTELQTTTGTQVGYILGNHDQGIDWLRLTDSVKHLDGCTVPLGQHQAYALDYTPLARFADALDGIPPGTTVLLAHQLWFELRRTDKAQHQGVLADLARRGIQYVLTGDFHQHLEETVHDADGRVVTVWSPGPLCAQSIRESGPKGFWALQAAGSRLVASSIPLQTRPLLRKEVRTEADLERCLGADVLAVQAQMKRDEAALGPLSKPMLEITYNPELPRIKARLQLTWEPLVHLFLKPLPTITAVADDTDSTALRQLVLEHGLLGVVQALASEQPLVASDACRLLTAADVRATLETVRDEFLQTYLAKEPTCP
jgi:hypothetical protein